MSDVHTTGASAPSGDVAVSADVNNRDPLRVAADNLAARRAEAVKAATQPQETEKPAQPRLNGKFAKAEDTAQAVDNDAPPEEVRVEDQPQDDPAELPPIEAPRSWSKEDKELFASLPRETQERVYERERSRESDFLKRQNEAAEKTKALTAKEQAAEQARQQYEQAASNALQILQAEQAREFPDIKSHDDVVKLAKEDPFRFAEFQARQLQVQHTVALVAELQRTREQEQRQSFETWAAEQDKTFVEHATEFADEKSAQQARKSVVDYLKERGVTQEMLPELWANPVFRDHRFQLVIRDAAKWHGAQKKATEAAKKPVPQVQRPGTAASAGDSAQAEIAKLDAKAKNATSEREQLLALAAKRAAMRAAAR